MNLLKKVAIAGLLGLASMASSHAAGVMVVCGDASLGIRTTTVDPAMAGSCYAGLQNLGDPALLELVETEYGIADGTAFMIDRDDANGNGGSLSITGVGSTVGTWSFDPLAWNDWDRIFLYFHFGDGKDCDLDDCTGFETDPDVFIVELMSPDAMGTWDFSGKQGLSNIALIGGNGNGNGGGPGNGNGNGGGPGNGNGNGNDVPEPATLALVGVSLLGLAAVRRRRRKG